MSRLRPSALALAGALLLGACEREGARGTVGVTDAAAGAVATFPDGTPRQRPEFEAIAERTISGGNPKFFPVSRLRGLQGMLDKGGLPAPKLLETRAEIARSHMEQGEVEKAVAEIDALCASAPDQVGLEYLRGLIHLRSAEVQNCILRHNADCCVFPLKDGGIHTQRAPSEAARKAFTRFAAAQPDDLRARWLLNLIAMALGDYPDAVPEALRIPPEAFASEYDIGRFEDVAGRIGLDVLNLAGGAVIEDFDGDGLLDVVTSSLGFRAPMAYRHNDGDGKFSDRTSASRLDDQLGGLNCIAGDPDGDGDMDVLVLRGGWIFEDGRVRKSLLLNDGHGVFTDVTRAAGLAEPPMPTQTATWADLDRDGDLDLYVGNESRVEMGAPQANYPCQLYRNEGDGRFTDIAPAAGVTNDRYAKGVAAGDYDDDGWVDLYVSNLGQNRLYRNLANLRFEDVAPRVNVTEPSGRSFATWFFDYDNDGRLDLWCGAYDATVADVCASYLHRPDNASRPALYHNDGGGKFTNVARASGFDRPILPMGANFGDLDEDGWLDLYLTTGDPNLDTLVPNLMFRNDGGKRFQDVTKSGGFGHLQKGHGVAFVDLDNDGDQDVFHEIGGFFETDAYRNALYLNPGHGNHFVTLVLRGAGKNTNALGARVRVDVATPTGPRSLHRAIGSVSSFGSSSLTRTEIGLGDATAITRVEIRWPASQETQAVEGVPLDSFVRIVEGKSGFEKLSVPVLSF